MAFKLYSESTGDYPRLTCDVCSGEVLDIWNSLATATPVQGQTVNVTVHHPACQAVGDVSISLIEFLKLFASKARIGDVGSSGNVETVYIRRDSSKEFEE